MKLINIQPKNMGIATPQDWRSWLNDLTEWQHDLLHNHRPEGGEIYRYPLVQYHNKGFVGLQEGATLLLNILPLLEAETDLVIDLQKHELTMATLPQTYHLRFWQPLNSNNYELWNSTKGLIERVSLLENILVGNILGFCRAMGFEIPEKSLSVKITGQLREIGFKKYNTLNADLYRQTFHLNFETNLVLPVGIGLGRGTSKGFGQVQHVAINNRKPLVVQ